MIRTAIRLLLAAFLAFVTAGLFIDWLGTSWWSRTNAALMALGVYGLFFIRHRESRKEQS